MSETKTVWHKWPGEQPPRDGNFLVTQRINRGHDLVSVMTFKSARGESPWGCLYNETDILAWAEITVDWHSRVLDPPRKPGEYIVMDRRGNILIWHHSGYNIWHESQHVDMDFHVDKWAELPEPYEPEQKS